MKTDDLLYEMMGEVSREETDRLERILQDDGLSSKDRCGDKQRLKMQKSCGLR